MNGRKEIHVKSMDELPYVQLLLFSSNCTDLATEAQTRDRQPKQLKHLWLNSSDFTHDLSIFKSFVSMLYLIVYSSSRCY
jgi:hypothetical protein